MPSPPPDLPARDTQGYLLDPATWTEVTARRLAAEDGIGELTPEHWRVITFLRDFHARKGAAPMIRVLVQETGLSLGRIYDLFPDGPARSACRIAGLPRPDGCV